MTTLDERWQKGIETRTKFGGGTLTGGSTPSAWDMAPDLERIAGEYDGVEQTYAIQAGRELRILVSADSVADGGVSELGRTIARRIEEEVTYPGRIKVTVIRETRVTEYAR